MSKFIFNCQKGYEEYMADEIRLNDLNPLEIKSGYVLAKSSGNVKFKSKNFCFPHFCMIDPVLIEGTSVNALSNEIAEKFFNSIRNKNIDSKWPFLTLCNPDLNGLGKRESAVRNQTMVYLKRIAGRISALANNKLPAEQGVRDGLMLYFEDFNKVYLATDFVWFGQKRVADDEAAPSRSFLKIEEAYKLMELEPREGQKVCDLGAAPGGWSYSAAVRNAKVTAIDNGELKLGAKNNPNITRLAEDAFKYEPASSYDWLFCDMAEQPNQVIKLIEKWIMNRWCRYFIVNLKFGRVRPVELLEILTDKSSIIKKRCLKLQVKHLFHDREEMTVMGRLE
ncbi:MAG: rRNA methyltransferase [Candidatus Delongbacteria bacterium]|nr:rRNA methyltransferase [Candidatus Delongbacteria bacterium]MCG2760937.1 rRNA methyltransferase [Candidatus Delongbacteria bacterium]